MSVTRASYIWKEHGPPTVSQLKQLFPSPSATGRERGQFTTFCHLAPGSNSSSHRWGFVIERNACVRVGATKNPLGRSRMAVAAEWLTILS